MQHCFIVIYKPFLSFLSLFIFVAFEALEMYLYHRKVIECRNKSFAHRQNTPAMFFISVF